MRIRIYCIFVQSICAVVPVLPLHFPSPTSRLPAPAAAPGGAALWRADTIACSPGAVRATGHAALDAQLPGGGWPVGALVEILQAQSGQNEWRLLLPALARAGQGMVVLVGAPHTPFGPGLAAQGLAPQQLLWVAASAPAARMWACEQALRCAEVLAVLAWLPQARPEQLRRLQMACSENAKLLFVMRPAQARTGASPAVLRLLVALEPGGDGLQLEVLKRRGPPCAQALQIPARNGRLAALLASSQARAGRRHSPVVPAAAGDGLAACGDMPGLQPFARVGDALDSLAGAA